MKSNPGSSTLLNILLAALAMTSTLRQVYAESTVVQTHCKGDERVVFSCPFKKGKTASLCASSDLSKSTGTLQYRYGVVGKTPELVFPLLGEHEDPTYDHPSRNFYWSHFYMSSLGKGRGSVIWANERWNPATVPSGDSVTIRLTFTPISDHPEIDFVIEAAVGPESRYEGTSLAIVEMIGQGRTIAEHRCIKEKTVENLFSLKDIIQK